MSTRRTVPTAPPRNRLAEVLAAGVEKKKAVQFLCGNDEYACGCSGKKPSTGSITADERIAELKEKKKEEGLTAKEKKELEGMISNLDDPMRVSEE